MIWIECVTFVDSDYLILKKKKKNVNLIFLLGILAFLILMLPTNSRLVKQEI